MITDMPPGTLFVIREKGAHRLWKVTTGGQSFTCVDTPVVAGQVVHFAVWTARDRQERDRLESRKTYTLREGDALWLDTGRKEFDFQKPPTAAMGFVESDQPIYRNKFIGGPAWLRAVSSWGVSDIRQLRDALAECQRQLNELRVAGGWRAP